MGFLEKKIPKMKLREEITAAIFYFGKEMVFVFLT